MKIITFTTLALLLLSTNVHAQEQKNEPQTLTNVLRHTYLKNPTLNIARRELRRVHEQLPQALAGWRPTLQVELSTNISDIEGSAYGSSADGSHEKTANIQLSQPLFRGGKTISQVKAAKNIIRAQNAMLSLTEQQVLRDAVSAYMDVVRNNALLSLSIKNKEVIEQQLQATKDRFDVGSVTKTDIKQAEARLAGAEADIIRISGDLDTSSAVYKQVVGITPNNLSKEVILPPLPLTLADALSIGKKHSPNTMIARFLHSAQDDNINSIVGDLLPQINLLARHSQTHDPYPGIPSVDQTDESIIGVYATIPLYQGGTTRSKVREAKEEKMARYIQINETELQVEQNIISSWKSFETAKTEINARKTQVDASRIARDGVYMEAEQGSRTVLDMLDADQELLNAEVNLIIAESNEIVTAYTLASVLGYLTPSNLNFSDSAIDLNNHLTLISGKIFSMDIPD